MCQLFAIAGNEALICAGEYFLLTLEYSITNVVIALTMAISTLDCHGPGPLKRWLWVIGRVEEGECECGVGPPAGVPAGGGPEREESLNTSNDFPKKNFGVCEISYGKSILDSL